MYLKSPRRRSEEIVVVVENCEKKYLKPQSPYAKIKLIGSAHNELEMHKKISQGCEEVFISPIFNTSSGGSKIGKGLLFYKKFLTQFKSCIKVNALGGIDIKNIRYISNYNGNGFASLSLIEKKISQKFISELKLIATNR